MNWMFYDNLWTTLSEEAQEKAQESWADRWAKRAERSARLKSAEATQQAVVDILARSTQRRLTRAESMLCQLQNIRNQR